MLDRTARLLRGESQPWDAFGASHREFLDFCRDQDLDGLVSRALTPAPVSWPSTLISELAERARAAAGVELVRARETRRVLGALSQAGVPALVYKGTALAYAAYPHPSLRPRNDTDLLIRPGDERSARAALEAIGYSATNLSGGAVLFRQFEVQRRDEFGLTHAVDVHWGFSTQAVFADLFSYEELFSRSVPLPGLGDAARTLCLADSLVVACIHPAMHHRNEERLIWVYDVHLLSGRLSPGEWDRVASLAVTKAVAEICHDALTRAVVRFGTAVPTPILARLHGATGNEPSAEYLRPGRAWADELSSSLGALGWRDRLRLMREVAFPAPRYMLNAYQLSGWPSLALLPALYAHRGARGVWKVLTGRK